MKTGGDDGSRGVVVRAPNHLGELILALPALERASRKAEGRALVQVVASLAPVVEMAGLPAEVLPLEGRHRLVEEAVKLRRRSAEVGVLLTPSFSAALLFLLAGVERRRGAVTDGRGWLLTDRVDRAPLLRRHRVAEYLHLVEGAGKEGPSTAEEDGSVDGKDGRRPDAPASEPGRRDGPARRETEPSLSAAGDPAATRCVPALSFQRDELPPPRLRDLREARRRWRELAEGLPAGPSPDGGGRTVGLVPGGNASSRRWPADRYRGLADRLADRGHRVLVFGGPSDRARTGRVAGGRAGVTDLGGMTSLWELAAGLESCDVVVANDTGPMHLAAALGRPTLALWGAGDPRQTGPVSESAWLAGSFDLPCVPCVENSCPRRGRGYVLEEASRECMRLVSVERVEELVEKLLARSTA